jgi:hypothetical protein
VDEPGLGVSESLDEKKILFFIARRRTEEEQTERHAREERWISRPSDEDWGQPESISAGHA